MATHRIQMIGSMAGLNTNGNAFFEPAAVNFGANDRYPHDVLVCNSQTAKSGIGGVFNIPKNFVGSGKIIVVWSTTATANDVVYDFDYKVVTGDVTNSIDPSADDANLTVTDTASGTARQRQTCEMSISTGLAADGTMLFEFSRDGANASDTLAAAAYVFDLIFEYADA